MVEIYIGSFCQDLKERVTTSRDNTNKDEKAKIVTSDSRGLQMENTVNKVRIEEPKSTARDTVNTLSPSYKNEQFETYNRNIGKNEYLSNAMERTEEALLINSPDPELKPTKMTENSNFNDV